MNLLIELNKTLRENYTGKINILADLSGQFLGEIHQYRGNIAKFSYKKMSGSRAIKEFAIDALIKKMALKFIGEPEAIIKKETTTKISSNFLIKSIAQLAKENSSLSLKSSKNCSILISRNFIDDLSLFSDRELEILCDIIELKSMKRLYQKSTISEQELAATLTSLEKQGVISFEKSSDLHT